MITGADNGTLQFSSDRCDPEPNFMKWLFSQKLPNSETKKSRLEKNNKTKNSKDEKSSVEK